MHGADHAAGGVQDDVKENYPQRDTFAHHSEQNEDVGHHHGGEQLEEIFHPQVDHPEPPEVGDREVGVVTGQQTYRIEAGDRQAGEEEHPWQIHLRLVAEPRTYAAPYDHNPQKQANGQQDLPQPRQVEKFPLLGEQTVHGDHAVDRECLANQRTGHHHDKRDQQTVYQPTLSPWFAATDE